MRSLNYFILIDLFLVRDLSPRLLQILGTDEVFDNARPHPDPLPSVFAALRRDHAETKVKADAERGQPAAISVLSVDRPANPATIFCKNAGNVSPSPSVFALLQRDHKI